MSDGLMPDKDDPHAYPDESATVSGSNVVGSGPNRVELIITHIGNKVINVVMLPVDEHGMPA